MIKKVYKRILPEKTRILIKVFLQKLVYPFYLGNKYYCNCCNKSFRKFLSKGNIRRQNAKCPYCSSLERTRLLDLYLDKTLKIYEKNGIKILHFAPEDCLFKKLSSLDIEYIDGDINPNYARNIIDITNIGFTDNYFDLIICSHVLGHVPDEEKAIKEMYRVLKYNGLAIVLTLINPNLKNTFEDCNIKQPADKLKYYGEPDLCRLHGLDFGNRLMKQGFSVKQIDYREQLPSAVVVKNSLGNGERELIYECKKNVPDIS
ncbi:MAG TPA: class I SAM-dependent methyltransferase [Saprospiraceae bacterium]|nr:class I SAM-dependent methyltransferase [Saprospiraceae bacterium]